jgi:hypothetical protein
VQHYKQLQRNLVASSLVEQQKKRGGIFPRRDPYVILIPQSREKNLSLYLTLANL